MCGRFTVTTKDTKKIADRFQVELEKALERKRRRKGAREKEQQGARPRAFQRRADPGDPRRALLTGRSEATHGSARRG